MPDITKPFLKWAGGKSRVLPLLKKKFPLNAKRYIEPFLGGGAVALNVDYPEIIVNDTNADLISVWHYLKEMGTEFIDLCKAFFVPENNTRETFDKYKKAFNSKCELDKLSKAILFVYFNRHCFNGLCRYNSKGEFNVPFGKYDKPYFPRKEMEGCLEKLKKFEIYQQDFRTIIDSAIDGDLVYCDEPYLPLSDTANFNTYSIGGFDLEDHIDLAQCSADAAKRGATVVVSSCSNWYANQIYGEMFGGKITKIKASRVISCKGEKRDSVEEMIVVYGKQGKI